MTKKLLYIETFGCQMNVNDSERIVTMLAALDYQPISGAADADMILLNTCSVRGGAEEKVYKRLTAYRAAKKRKEQLIIGVGGCVAQQEGEELLRKFPWLDLVFGTHNLHLLPDMVRDAEAGKRRCETSFIDNEQRLDLFPPVAGSSRISRFVTVMQGCDNFCSYCIVPHVRGREISRRSADILTEIRQLAGDGVREVVLLGQNVNSYGLKGDGEPSFAALLGLVAQVDGIERIRFTTSHPKDMSPALIACFADIPKLCPQIHLPAQSGSDRVLHAMKRGYTREGYLETVRRLREVCPDIAITGDMIVGFPGESEENFQETLSLMDAVGYADLFSFVYSPRPGTMAAELPEVLSRQEKLDRLERLQEKQRQHTRRFNESRVGSKQMVMVEGEGKKPGQVSGKIPDGRIVNVTGPVDLIGSFMSVRISLAYQNSLLGERI